MGGFIQKWKDFRDGRLKRIEAKQFLEVLFKNDVNKEFEDDLSQTWEENGPDDYAQEIEAVIENFKKRHQKKSNPFLGTTAIKIFSIKRLLLLAACIGAGFFLFSLPLNFFPKEPGPNVELVTISKSIIKSNGKGQKSKFTLPDGSVVYLNASSRLSYGNDFNENRVLALEGEAYFEVAKDSLKPFRVIAGDIETTALGTAFNVNAFQEEKVKVALASGKVLVSDYKNKDQVTLQPGEYTQFIPKRQELVKFPIAMEKISLWKEGILYFEKVPFQDLVPLLENWYNVDIEIRGSVPNDKCTGEFRKNEYLSNVLKVLGHSIGFSFDIQEDKIKIYIEN